MEIKKEDYVEQLYKGEIKAILTSLCAIERRLTELKLDKFANSVKAIVVALSVEELGEEVVEKLKNEKKLSE